MNKKITLKAEERKEGGKETIREGYVPAVVYGPETAPLSLKVKKLEFEHVFAAAGESNIIDLVGSGDPMKVIIKGVQADPIKGNFIHVDFYKLDMNKKITTEIPLHFIGESKAVKELAGVLVKAKDSLGVKCLPHDLVDHIDIDLSGLNTFEDSIRIKDLKEIPGIEFVDDHEEMLVHVMEPKKEEEVQSAPAEAAAAPAPAAEEKK